MPLRRRELIAAVGTGTGLAVVVPRMDGSGRNDDAPDDITIDERARADLLALADLVYPDAVDFEPSFVTSHVSSRVASRKRGIRDALVDLDRFARRWYGGRFASLSAADRTGLLAAIGVGRVGSDPDGTVPERIRYYLVNELLYALYTDPLGSELFGISNPVGYPGGYDSYQQEPTATRAER